MCRKPLTISIQHKIYWTSSAVLNVPVLCSWMLLATLMWPSIVLLRAVTAPAVAVLLHCPSRRANWNMM